MRIVTIVILALSLAGCAGTVPPWLQDAEQKAAAVVAKIKAAAPVVQGEIDTAIGAICGHLPEVKSGVDVLAQGFVNPGPKTQRFIAVADNSIAVAMGACASWAAAPSTSGSVSFFLRLYNAYVTGKRAYADAKAAGGV